MHKICTGCGEPVDNLWIAGITWVGNELAPGAILGCGEFQWLLHRYKIAEITKKRVINRQYYLYQLRCA